MKEYSGWKLALALLTAAALAACGGGSVRNDQSAGGNGPPAAEGTVSLSLKQTTQAGSLSVALGVGNAPRLHQLSLRLLYDPLAVRPAASARGALLDESCIFFAPVDKQSALDGGFVPLAFTCRLNSSLAAAAGELARIEFDVLDASRDPGIRVLDAADYLIARDAQRQPLELRFEAQP